MTIYSYAQLEGLWDEAGGPSDEASLAAAIAEAESGGNSLAAYPGTTVAAGQGSTTDATGLWQILGLPAGNFTAAELTDPYENAEMAVAKYTQAGDSFSPWQTYDEGDYTLQNVAPTSQGIPTGPGAAAVDTSSGGSGFVWYEPWTWGSAAEQGITDVGQNLARYAATGLAVVAGLGLVVWGIGRATGVHPHPAQTAEQAAPLIAAAAA